MAGKRTESQHLPDAGPLEKPSELKSRELIEIEASVFSGPLPLPDLIAEYDRIIPNGAERIMAMAERQSSHRETMEASVVRGNIASQTRGSYFAFILALVSILGGLFLIYSGRSAAGLASIIASVGALAGVFVYSKYEERKERGRKLENLQSRRSNR